LRSQSTRMWRPVNWQYVTEILEELSASCFKAVATVWLPWSWRHQGPPKRDQSTRCHIPDSSNLI